MVDNQNSVQASTGYWITRLARSMERDFEKHLEPLGITRGAFAVLSAIDQDNKTKPAELAAFLRIDGAAVTRYLERVENQGLIERKLSATDRRSIDINLTADGRRAVRHGSAGSRATNEKFTAGLTVAEVDRFISVLQTMLSKSDVAVTDI